MFEDWYVLLLGCVYHMAGRFSRETRSCLTASTRTTLAYLSHSQTRRRTKETNGKGGWRWEKWRKTDSSAEWQLQWKNKLINGVTHDGAVKAVQCLETIDYDIIYTTLNCERIRDVHRPAWSVATFSRNIQKTPLHWKVHVLHHVLIPMSAYFVGYSWQRP